MRASARRQLVLLAVVAVLTTLLSAPAAAHAADVDYFAANGGQESMLSEMAIHPSSVRVGSVTYLAYQGPGYDPYVAAYDEATGQWQGPVRVGSNPLSLDAHGAPSIFVDDQGRLHVLYGSHNLPMKHAVEYKAGDINAWIQLSSPSHVATYPQPIRLPDGRLLLFYRQGGEDFFGWVMRVSRDGGNTWDDGYGTVLAAGSGHWYAHFAIGRGGIVHCAFCRYDSDYNDTFLGRRNLYYIWRDTNGIWRNTEGDPVTMPVTLASADKECKVYDSGSDVVNEVVVKDDASSTDTTPAPLIEFINGTGKGPDAYRWAFARRNETTWTISTITNTDMHFDAATFQPHTDGSIDSYLVTGGSYGLDSRPDPEEGRGGALERWRSEDHGLTWSFQQRISPDETGTLFSDPQVVESPSGTSTVMFTEWTNDYASFFHRLYLWGQDTGFAKRTIRPRVDRVAGDDRVRTAIEASKVAFPERSQVVLLATSRNYPDALAAAPLGAALRGPVLLVPPTGLPDVVAAEIDRLAPGRVIILGSTGAVSDAVQRDLLAKTAVRRIERVAGVNRTATALAVADRLHAIYGPLHAAVVVSGNNFPDAVSAASFAAWAGYPILLCDGATVSTTTAAAIAAYDVTSTVVVGGPGVVPETYAVGLPSPTRLAGDDRYLTSAAVARYALDNGLLPERMIVASGLNFPDALSAGVLGAKSRAPVLLVQRDTLPDPVHGVFEDEATRTTQVWAMGGSAVVSARVTAHISALLDPEPPK